MKKILSVLILITMIFLSSCSFSSTDTINKVTAPTNKFLPISGKWVVTLERSINKREPSDKPANDLTGKTAIFDGEIAALNDTLCKSPVYKTKYVNSSDYLFYRYKLKPEQLGISSSDIQVITITSANHFFNEFIKTGDSDLITYSDGCFIYLKKVSDEVDTEYKKKLMMKDSTPQDNSGQDDDTSTRSGLLLGLKSNENPSGGEWKYRTIWISMLKGRTLCTTYEHKNLFIPRKNGFWELYTERKSFNDGRTQDIFTAYPVDKKVVNGSNGSYARYNEASSILRTILYASSDYVCTERVTTSTTDKKNLSDKVYEVFPIDNIENSSPVKISDICGENGKNALYDAALRYLTSLGKMGNQYIYPSSEENFGLFRRNGHWVIKGRLNSDTSTGVDFNINAIPSSKLVDYDELCIPWSIVKSFVPEAKDVYTSPNRDIAVIITNNSILIFTIRDGVLSENPIKKLRLKDNESVVMAEWASGSYGDKWHDEFINNAFYIIDR